MATNANLISIAPVQASSSTRNTSQSAQPKYKSPPRAGKKNFSSTLDKINAKLDELKQGVKDLKNINQEPAQVEDDAPKVDESNVDESNVDEQDTIPAQGKSNTPQDAKAIRNKELGIRNDSDSESIAEKDSPADIFLGANNFSATETPKTKIFDAPETLGETPVAEKIPVKPDKLEVIPENVEGQSPSNILAANSMAYLFNMNSESLLKPVINSESVETVQEITSIQNLQSLLPTADNKNAQSMLQMLGGGTAIRNWELGIRNGQSAEVIQPSQPITQAQPVEQIQVQLTQSQPITQAQPVEQIQVQPTQSQLTAPTQPVEQIQVQTSQPQPITQAQPVEQIQIQPSQPQPTTPTQPVEPIQIQPSQPQPTTQAQPVEQIQVQPTQSQLTTPTQPVEPVQIQTSQPQPTTPTQPVEPVQIQPTQPQPIIPTQPVEQVQIQPTQPQPIIPTQPVEQVQIQPTQPQPTTPTQPVEPIQIQPTQPQPTTPTQPVEQVQIQLTQPQPTTPTQPVEQVQVQSSQPILQQKLDERPAPQNLSEPLGVNIQIEEAPTAAPVTPSQPTPQQFNQNLQQQDNQNFQNQISQPIISDQTQAQPISTGGEIFAANLATASDTPQTQPTAPTQAPETPPMPQDDFDVPAQIVRQARLIRTAENSEMVIKLNPEHLGELTLRVSVSSSGAINASFHSDNAQVRTIIENSLVQLRNDLNNAGLKVENVQVYAGLSDGGLMNGQGGQAWQQNRRQSSGNRRINFDSLEHDVDSTAPVNEAQSADGVDYSV